jgi:hypothetical protein
MDEFVLDFVHSNPLNQLYPEATSAFGQVCRQAKSRPACWFATDLEASDHFSLAKVLGVSNGKLSIILKLAGVTEVDRKGVECVNKECLKEIFVNAMLTKSRWMLQRYQLPNKTNILIVPDRSCYLLVLYLSSCSVSRHASCSLLIVDKLSSLCLLPLSLPIPTIPLFSLLRVDGFTLCHCSHSSFDVSFARSLAADGRWKPFPSCLRESQTKGKGVSFAN